MEVTTNMVKELREMTGAGVLDCRNALVETEGNVQKAVDYLRKKGLAAVAKRSGRSTAEGLVHSYIHAGGKIGVLVEVNCETDFVAKTDEFQTFVKDVAMHIAAAGPLYLSRETVPASVLEAERNIYREQVKEMKKPESVTEKIVDGKIDKYYRDICLLEQPFVKDPEKSIQDVLNERMAKLGENMGIKRFARFQLGEAVTN